MRVKKLEHIRVLKKLGFTKKKEGRKEQTYVLMIGGKMELMTDVAKGRGEIPDGTMSKILNSQIYLTQEEYKKAQAGKLSPDEYVTLLRKKDVLKPSPAPPAAPTGKKSE